MARRVAPAKHFVGLYHYCPYWRCWDKIVAIKPPYTWVVQDVRTGKIREHMTPLEAGHFADAPFEPTYDDLRRAARAGSR